MPKLIIPMSQGRATCYELIEPITIGRGEEADLVLNNASVSREHARIDFDRGIATIVDLDSNNGLRVNGEKVSQSRLESGDEIRIGRFTLVLLADSERFYRGRNVESMIPHGTSENRAEDATYTLAQSDIVTIEKRRRLVRDARIVLASNTSRFWYPEDRSLTFGKNAMILVEGTFAGALVADVVWRDHAHFVRRHSKLVKVLVNGASVSEQELKPGDSLKIGKVSFLYELAKSD